MQRQLVKQGAVFAVLLACLGLGVAGLADHKPGHPKPGGGGKQDTSETPVSVTFRDDFDDRITSERLGLGPYVDGSGVRAVITPNGKLNMEFSGSRELNINLSDLASNSGESTTCADDTGGCLFDPVMLGTDFSVASVALTVLDVCDVNEGTGLDGGLLALPVGGPTHCARMGFWVAGLPLGSDGKDLNWVERFRPNIWPETNEVAVERTGENTWVVTANGNVGVDTCPDFGACSALVRAQQKKGRGGTRVEGFFLTPFQLTITTIQ